MEKEKVKEGEEVVQKDSRIEREILSPAITAAAVGLLTMAGLLGAVLLVRSVLGLVASYPPPNVARALRFAVGWAAVVLFLPLLRVWNLVRYKVDAAFDMAAEVRRAIQPPPPPVGESTTLANAAPLGFAAFGLPFVVLSTINAGWLSGDSLPVVVPLAFACGLAQGIAGAYEFRNGSTLGCVTFTAYGAFWWWFAFLLWTIGAGWLKPPSADGIGFTLLMWGVFTVYMWVPAFATNFCLWLFFLTLWVTFFMLAFGELGWGSGWHLAGGYLGITCGSLALYLSFAEVTNTVFGRTVIPVGPALSSSSPVLPLFR